MKLIIAYRRDFNKGIEVPSYANSYVREFKALGHEVLTLSENQDVSLDRLSTINLNQWDLILDIDNGRNPDGDLPFIGNNFVEKGPKWVIPTAVIFTDSHGQSTLHHRLAAYYTHVFFAVWSRRDLFAKHKSAHFLPNATDLLWFGYEGFTNVQPEFQFGFFGSKHGLDRADPMIGICERRGWTYDVRQINGAYKPKFPYTGEAMRRCHNLFNHGQKHDINLRIFESMAVMRPLVCDLDPESGLDLLFTPGKHFVPYDSYTYVSLDEAMEWVVNNPKDAIIMAVNAYEEVKNKHLIKHRVQRILDVIS